MSGHSHWAGIKYKKEITDAKKGQAFSKLLQAITAAAKSEPNPDFNPRLRTAVEKAKAQKVPIDTIERAISRAKDSADATESLLFEAYGPGGAALIIEAVSDNRNRTVPEIKKILSDFEGKWGEAGSVRWAFEGRADGSWQAKFPAEIPPADKEKLARLVEALEAHADVQSVTTNAK